MGKLLRGLVMILLLSSAMTLPAEESIFASYNTPGNLNVYGSIGWGVAYPLGATVSGEIILGQFSLGPMPFDWGAMATWIEFYLSGFGLGSSALATIHLGLAWNLDFYLGLGLCVNWVPVGWGFAQSAGVVYKISDHFSIQLEDLYLGEFGSSSLGVYGVGVVIKPDDR